MTPQRSSLNRLLLRLPVLAISIIILKIKCLWVPVCGLDDYVRGDFPPDFVFGCGTSAYQVEGAAFEDGRTPSIWDTYVHSGIVNEGNGDVACDTYHKYKEDVKLMADMGLKAYRFSISWSRLIPNGRGSVNPKGLQYYNNLINELINHGIQPYPTLFHVDTPQALEDEYGGWLSWEIVRDFTVFADECFKEFGDRVLYWTTLNEPNIFALGGYDYAQIPPGRCSLPFGKVCTQGNSSTEPYIAVHNMLLAHSSAVKLYKKKYQATQRGFVGINIYTFGVVPCTDSTADIIATQRANDYYIGWLVNPLIYGDYPDIMKKNGGTRMPVFTPDESKLVKGAFDFFGLNHYTTICVKDNPSSLNEEPRDVTADMAIQIIYGSTHFPPDQYSLTPSGLYGVLEYFKEVYGNPPIYIQENGQRTDRNGTLNDTLRVQYLHAYIGAVLDAVRNGSNTRGYFMWSLLDGFELLDGFKSSYGLFYVDLDDKELKRHPKLSAAWYSNFLKGRSSTMPGGLIDAAKYISAS
ncbi:hypothetical protein ACH5RR_010784 [Cinchona calisaya]|uniref:Uncharacterized protein n=1 Tax=Cinchona calisaya TaxID=153742 RepID=A0ABD3AJW7_9GENT